MISNSNTLTNNFPDILIVYCIFIISYFLLKRNRNYTENYVTPSGVFDSRGKTLRDKISCDTVSRHLRWFSMSRPRDSESPRCITTGWCGTPPVQGQYRFHPLLSKVVFISTIHAPIAHDNDNIHTNIVVSS